MAPSGGRGAPDVSLLVKAGCNLACAVCDCRGGESPRGPDGWPRELARGGSLLEFRGEAALQARLAEAVARARAAGWATIRVRTNGIAFAHEAHLRRLRQMGIDEVAFFLASDRASAHDSIVRVPGAHAAALRGARALSDAGFRVCLEIPVLDPSLQDLAGTVRVAREAAHTARYLRLYSPAAPVHRYGQVPARRGPPRWDLARAAQRDAVAAAREHALQLGLTERDGIPLCAMAGDDPQPPAHAMQGIFAPRGNRPIQRGGMSWLGKACRSCRSAATCPGVTRLYLETHRDAGLVPLARRVTIREPRRDTWDDARREAARRVESEVLRPTLDCNQDCWFCSANDTSRNVEEDPRRMKRRIGRLARLGRRRVAFGGGEPTLSRHLAEYVRTARRAGIRQVDLVTNAVRLDRPERAADLMEAGLSGLEVSLHAHDESLSRAMTRKAGDHARTVRALHLFAPYRELRLNVIHVVSSQNYRSLVRFVEWMHEEFGTRVGIAFAYLTPQFRALEHLAQRLPRFADAMPYLKRAVARAAELQIAVVVGSRQGVPPCLLDELLPFSDVLSVAGAAAVEDRAQKQKDAACVRCRLDPVCTGFWKAYAEIYGTSEARPLPGEKVGPEAAGPLAGPPAVPAMGVASPALWSGDRPLPRSADIPLPGPERERRPPPAPAGRLLRVALVGSGGRARVLARALERTGRFELAAIVSPHVRDKDLPEVAASVTRVQRLEEALGSRAVDAVIVASATADHAPSARLAMAAGLPCLVEKPFTATAEEARALASQGDPPLSVGHQMRFAGGFQELCDAVGAAPPAQVSITFLATPGSAGALRSWAREPLGEILAHLADLVLALAGAGLRVTGARATGGARPEHVVVRAGPAERSLAGARTRVQIELVLAAPEDGLRVAVLTEGGRRLSWTRDARHDEVALDEGAGARVRTAPPGNDLERLLCAWHEALLHRSPFPVGAAEGLAAMELAAEALAALDASGAPFERSREPRHRPPPAPARESR